ncbi:DUF4123 domain-containing protein [Halocynthiibacter namhaensis]|uniref:DUF4123 domain-containing protein n=1 Tax=Halocynthiibacter namhaensis TaxID=1290553 RepID=UPI000578F88C|nr:DUF4123 domain-containing protein [Halocynthiibacter namhaensis]
MGVFEPWVAECHLQNIETTDEYLCKAAIWADGHPLFRARLKAHFQGSGYKLLWLEECLTASQYIARHGQQKEIGSLARAVHDGRVIQLSEILASNGGVVAQPEAYLKIEEITGIEPLDQQFGVHPRKTVPDALLEPLFGEVPPTDVEIEKYGGIDAVPLMKTYAILDAAKMPYMLTTQLDSSGLQHQSLFQGETAEELKEHAPYLVQLEDGNRFTEKLFTGPKGVNGLWEKELGIYIRSRASFSDVRKHFRKFTRLQDNKGAWYYLRFWEENTVLSIFSLKENRETICRFVDLSIFLY